MSCAREATLTFSIMYLSPLTPEDCLLVNLFFQSYMLPLFFSGLLSYLLGIKWRTSRHVHARETTLTFLVILSPLKPKSCADHNSHTV